MDYLYFTVNIGTTGADIYKYLEMIPAKIPPHVFWQAMCKTWLAICAGKRVAGVSSLDSIAGNLLDTYMFDIDLIGKLFFLSPNKPLVYYEGREVTSDTSYLAARAVLGGILKIATLQNGCQFMELFHGIMEADVAIEDIRVKNYRGTFVTMEICYAEL